MRNLWAEGNTIFNSDGGLWGSMGQNVTVVRNHVENCLDVCLDAEGSNDVSFTENHARNAGHAVVDVFHYSKNVSFTWNDIRSDGSYGGYLFHTHNSAQDPGEISIRAHNNWFRYTGASGVGLAGKEASHYLLFQNNTLEDVAIDFRTNNAGGVQVGGNTLTFTRSTGTRPALAAGNNYVGWGGAATPVNGPWELLVGGNDISSTVAQSAAGVVVDQPGGCCQIDSYIFDHQIRGFSPSISISRDNASLRHFRIENNGHTAGIPAPATTVTVVGNYWL